MAVVAASTVDRMRRMRARQRAGLSLLTIEVDTVALAESLVSAKLLTRAQVDNREAISTAVGKLLEHFIGERS